MTCDHGDSDLPAHSGVDRADAILGYLTTIHEAVVLVLAEAMQVAVEVEECLLSMVQILKVEAQSTWMDQGRDEENAELRMR